MPETVTLDTGVSLTAQERFVASASPPEWARTGLELRYSANALYIFEFFTVSFSSAFDPMLTARSAVSRSVFLLYGLAIENMLKAIAVVADATLIRPAALDKKLKSHNLIELARLGNVTLDTDETSICTILSTADVYWGRYPVPLISSKLDTEHSITKDTVSQLDVLFYRLFAELSEKLKVGWDSGLGVRIFDYEPFVRGFSVTYQFYDKQDTRVTTAEITYEFEKPES